MSSEGRGEGGSEERPADERTILSPGTNAGGPASGGGAADAPASRSGRAESPNIPGISIQSEIARGGMGVVYRGRQDYLDREVAVKVLSAQLEGEQFTARFQREAKILAGISHPHIVACHQAGLTEDGRCYLAMEFVGGQNLQEWLDERGCMPIRSALRLTASLATALAHAHELGIIHRDIKAANVLMDGSTSVDLDPEFPFRPKLVDLGLAKFTQPSIGGGDLMVTSPGTVMGTPSTMSPEQFDDPDNVDFRADIYGLGCILHRALIGSAAFGQGSMTDMIVAKRERFGPNPSRANPAIPGPVGELVSRMLACDRGERPGSYSELIGQLERLVATTPEGTKLCDTDAGVARSTIGQAAAQNITASDERLLRTAELNFLIEPGDGAGKDGGLPQPANPDRAVFTTQVAQPPPQLQPAQEPARSKGGLVAGGLVAIAIAIGGGVWWSQSDPSPEPDTGGGELPAKTGGPDPAKPSATEHDRGTASDNPPVQNRAPVGRFELPATVEVGAEIPLRAVVSDPDGDPLEVAWRQVGDGVRVQFETRDGVSTRVRFLDALPGEAAVFELTLRDGVTAPVVVVQRVSVDVPPAERLFGDSRETALANWIGPETDSVGRWTPTESADISGLAREGTSFRTTSLPAGLWRASGVFHPQKMWSAEGDVFPRLTGVHLEFGGECVHGEFGSALAMCMSRHEDRWRLELCGTQPSSNGGWKFLAMQPRMFVEWTDEENAVPGFFEFTKRSGELVCAFGAVGGVAKKTTLDCAHAAGETGLSIYVDGGRALYRDFLLR